MKPFPIELECPICGNKDSIQHIIVMQTGNEYSLNAWVQSVKLRCGNGHYWERSSESGEIKIEENIEEFTNVVKIV